MTTYVCQFISASNGVRSEPFTTTLDNLAKNLRETDPLAFPDYILVIGSYTEDCLEKQLEFAQNPLFTIESLLRDQFPEDFIIDTDEGPMDIADPRLYADNAMEQST